MGLHLIIDGYNLIRSSPSLSAAESSSLEEGREALIERLTAYKRIKAWAITVVFDAGRGPHLAEKRETARGVQIVYSGAGETADQVIVRMARRMGEKAVVVTSDRALAGLAAAAGATVIDSPEFENRLEMAFFMDIKGAEPEADRAPTLSTRKKGPEKRRSKADRKRSARLKKL